jgi:hypothetical protein
MGGFPTPKVAQKVAQEFLKKTNKLKNAHRT